MTGFDPQNTGVGSDRSTDCATTTCGLGSLSCLSSCFQFLTAQLSQCLWAVPYLGISRESYL